MFRQQAAAILRELQVWKMCSMLYRSSNANGKILYILVSLQKYTVLLESNQIYNTSEVLKFTREVYTEHINLGYV